MDLGIIWDSLWHLLLNILVAINSVVHVPGVSIIIFTILIRALTIPLTMKSLRSNRNMQAIQPLMKEIQKRYKDDRAKQQEETMKLYSQYGINPAAGCFPLLVQIPIFFGLYAALRFTLDHGTDVTQLQAILWNHDWIPYANFGATPFLWVPNLAASDPLFIWPVLSGLFQFFQGRMSMPRRDPNAPVDAQQRMMSGMMQLMPIYITLISLGFPVGNVIYWAFSSLFGAVQQYFITGFGMLPDFPGFGWLPRKAVTPPQPPPQPAEGTARRGLITRMMDRALQAQEARKTEDGSTGGSARVAQEGEPTRAISTSTSAGARAGARAERPRNGARAATARVKSKASEPNIRIVQSSGTNGKDSGAPAVKYASDMRKQNNSAATTELPPRKKKR